MSGYQLFVPSRGRARRDLQYTINGLSETAKANTTLVVRHDEVGDYANLAQELGVGLVARPETCTNLSQTLNWIIHSLADPAKTCIMADDDLRFSIRISDKAANLRQCDPEDVDAILADLDDLVRDDYPLAGVSARFGNNNRFPDKHQYCGRQMQVHAVDVQFFRDNGIYPSQVVTKSDFFMTLSVLTRGRENAIICYAAVDQAKGSNSAGGVSSYRTLEVMDEGARKLHSLFPEFVKLVQKRNDNWKGLGAEYRTDVQVAWKQAYKRGGR